MTLPAGEDLMWVDAQVCKYDKDVRAHVLKKHMRQRREEALCPLRGGNKRVFPQKPSQGEVTGSGSYSTCALSHVTKYRGRGASSSSNCSSNSSPKPVDESFSAGPGPGVMAQKLPLRPFALGSRKSMRTTASAAITPISDEDDFLEQFWTISHISGSHTEACTNDQPSLLSCTDVDVIHRHQQLVERFFKQAEPYHLDLEVVRFHTMRKSLLNSGWCAIDFPRIVSPRMAADLSNLY